MPALVHRLSTFTLFDLLLEWGLTAHKSFGSIRATYRSGYLVSSTRRYSGNQAVPRRDSSLATCVRGRSPQRNETKPEPASRPPQNYVTFETDFGPARVNYWHGLEVTANARLRNGPTFQGGTSTGREIEDTCETIQNYSRPAGFTGSTFTRSPRDCREVDPLRTTFRGSAAYTIPKVDVLVSAIVRLQPAPELMATYLVPNTVVAEQLGHLPAGGTATGNQMVALLNENQMYADKRHRQVDMRLAKIFRLGSKRVDFGVDLYNLFNVNTPTTYDANYDAPPAVNGGEWMRPTAIVRPRFARLNLTVNF